MNPRVRTLLLTGACLLASLLFSGWYVPHGNLRWLAAAVAVLPLIPALRFRLARRDERLLREQGVYLFQVLQSRVSIGEPLARAFAAASREAERVWGTRSSTRSVSHSVSGARVLFTTALRGLAGELDHRVAWGPALDRFVTRFPCREAAPVLIALAQIQPLGAGAETLLRMGGEMVSEAIAVQDAVTAESAQRQMEAVAVAAMPPVMVWLLGKLAPAYLAPMRATPTGLAVLAALYVLSVLSLALVARVVADPRPSGRRESRRSQRGDSGRPAGRDKRAGLKTALAGLSKQMLAHLSSCLPSTYRARLGRQLAQAAPVPDEALERYLATKAGWVAAGAAIGVFLTWAAGAPAYWIAIGATALPFLQDYDLRRRLERARDRYLETFPVFLGMLTAVLHTGLPLGSALDLSLAALPPAREPFSRALAQIRAETRGGRAAAPGFERMAAHTDIPEIQAALSLIAQYERAGGAQHLALLRLQIPVCRSLYRNTIRRRVERQMARLLVPMFLSLLLVILITGLPAVMGLRAS